MELLITAAYQGVKRMPKNVFALWLILVIGYLYLGIGSSARAAIPLEYQVKGVFLFNFTQFVEWPPQTFSDEQSPLVIGILGEDPFGTFLDETIRGEQVNNRPLIVQRYRYVEDIQDCHVLFISASEASRLELIFSSLKDRSILTVGDYEGFALNGGMIRFVMVEKKIRFRINVDAAEAAHLTISSKLLRSADIVSTEAH